MLGELMTGLVIQKNAGLFRVLDNQRQCHTLRALGNVKKAGIYVGDNVEFQDVILSVQTRKNRLIRPPIANIDKLFIVISPSPRPDFLLVDKLILYCKVNDIEPILVLNKTDLASATFLQDVKSMYQKVLKLISVSAATGEVAPLVNEIEGICVLAGQSAVGKSSLINSLKGEEVAATGELSKKVERGKQTTRISELFLFENGYLADTAGFSLLDAPLVLPIDPPELSRYYPDFFPYLASCKYRSCLHEIDGDCGILKAVDEGAISQMRYENYLKILDSLK